MQCFFGTEPQGRGGLAKIVLAKNLETWKTSDHHNMIITGMSMSQPSAAEQAPSTSQGGGAAHEDDVEEGDMAAQRDMQQVEGEAKEGGEEEEVVDIDRQWYVALVCMTNLYPTHQVQPRWVR